MIIKCPNSAIEYALLESRIKYFSIQAGVTTMIVMADLAV